MSLPDDQKHTLMKIAGARLAGAHFKAIYGHTTTYREAKMSKRILTPLKNGRTLMASQVQPLLDAGFIQLRSEGTAVVIEQTDKRP